MILPLHPFSKKILLYELVNNSMTTDNAIYVTGRDMLFHHVNYMLSSDYINIKSANNKLTTSLKIKLSHAETNRIEKYAYQAGLYIYKLHLQQLLHFVEAQKIAGENAMSAIRTFFDRYNIEADDIDINSVYRMWTRHQKKINKIEENFQSIHRTRSKHVFELNIPTESDDLDRMCDSFFVKTIEYFFDNTKNKLDHNLFEQMRTYIHYHFSKLSFSQLAEIWGLSKDTLYYRYRSFRDYLDVNQDFQHTIEKLKSA